MVPAVTGFANSAMPHSLKSVCRFRKSFASYLTRGSVSQVWNGGGDGSVHSSVVAPAPHGLAGACCFLAKAEIRQMKNTIRPAKEMNAPIEETMFQPAKASG